MNAQIIISLKTKTSSIIKIGASIGIISETIKKNIINPAYNKENKTKEINSGNDSFTFP